LTKKADEFTKEFLIKKLGDCRDGDLSRLYDLEFPSKNIKLIVSIKNPQLIGGVNCPCVAQDLHKK
jgi:hypothetical protein